MSEQLPSDREPGTGVVDTEAALDILRDIVANVENKHRLERQLKDQFQPGTYLLPHKAEVPTVLIESAMKALGLPYPKAPTPRRIPSIPTPTQAEALEALTVTHEGVPMFLMVPLSSAAGTTAFVETPGHMPSVRVRAATRDALQDYKWVERTGENNWRRAAYRITEAGREALARYQAKKRTAA